MRLTERHIVRDGAAGYDKLCAVAHLSKNLYNAGLYAVRQQFFEDGHYMPYAALCKKLQDDGNPDYVAMPRKVSQQTLRMLDRNFKSFFAAIKEYGKDRSKFKRAPSLPRYLDKEGFYTVAYTKQAVSKKEWDKGVLKLSGVEGVTFRTKVSYDALDEVRVEPMCGHIVVSVAYTVPDVALLPDNGRYAAIDLGIDNLATVASNVKGFKTFAISGKALKSYNHRYNQLKAKYQSVAELRNKRKKTKRLRSLESKRRFYIDDYMHKASRLIVNRLVSESVNTLVIGYNKEWKQDTDMHKDVNQNFVAIPHKRLVDMLRYKCALVGINVLLQEESYTSKCSFLDGEEVCKHDRYAGRRRHRGLFRASDGRLINADVNGALNILRKCKPKAFADGIGGVVVHPVIIKMANGCFSDFH